MWLSLASVPRINIQAGDIDAINMRGCIILAPRCVQVQRSASPLHMRIIQYKRGGST